MIGSGIAVPTLGTQTSAYKVLTGNCMIAASVSGVYSLITRDHELKIQENGAKYVSLNSVVSTLNALPSYIMSANTVSCLKSSLDEFW